HVRPFAAPLVVSPSSRLHLFLRVLLTSLPDSRTHWTTGSSSRRKLSPRRGAVYRRRGSDLVRADRALVVEHQQRAHRSVLGGNDSFAVVALEPVATWNAAGLFHMLFVVCMRRTGFLQLSVRRHVAGSRHHFPSVCSRRLSPRPWRRTSAFPGKYVFTAMGMVSHLF